MKPIILITALVGFNAIGSYAQSQNNPSYLCTEKRVQYDVIPIAQDAPTTGKYIYYSQDTVIQSETFVPVPPLAPTESSACTKTTEGGLTVTHCPGATYKSDNTNVYEYGSDGTYLGYYPITQDQNMTCVKVQPAAKTQHVVYRWTIPANAQNNCCQGK
jgi:hypothetical protein